MRDRFAVAPTTNLVAHVSEAGSRYQPACKAFDEAKACPAMAFVKELELILNSRRPTPDEITAGTAEALAELGYAGAQRT